MVSGRYYVIEGFDRDDSGSQTDGLLFSTQYQRKNTPIHRQQSRNFKDNIPSVQSLCLTPTHIVLIHDFLN